MSIDIDNKKKARNKKVFLDELKGALDEIKAADAYANKTGLEFSEAFDVIKKKGGIRAGAGAPKKARIATNRSVKLTDEDYQKIIKKYGSFTNGVKSLLKDKVTTAA